MRAGRRRHGRARVVSADCEELTDRAVGVILTAMDDITPSDLARDLGVTPVAVRAFLRSRYGTLAAQGRGQRWHLSPSEATAVREYFPQD